MKDKLVDLINSVEYGHGSKIGRNFKRTFIERIADHLIANGVIIQPVLKVTEKADIDRICKDMVWKCTEMCQPGMWELYTKNMECGEIREFAQYYKDLELLYKVLTGHEMFAPSLEDKE